MGFAGQVFGSSSLVGMALIVVPPGFAIGVVKERQVRLRVICTHLAIMILAYHQRQMHYITLFTCSYSKKEHKKFILMHVYSYNQFTN